MIWGFRYGLFDFVHFLLAVLVPFSVPVQVIYLQHS